MRALALALSALFALPATARPGARGGDGAGEQLLTLHLRLLDGPEGTVEERYQLHELEYELMARLDVTHAGAVRDERIGDGWFVLRLSGPDARRIWQLVEAPVRAAAAPGSWALLEAAGTAERIELVGATAGGATPPR